MDESASTGQIAVLLFTDIVDSVAMQQRLGTQAYAEVLRQHDQLFRRALETIPGSERYQDTGDGQLARFGTAADGVNAALRFQALLRHAQWPQEAPKVRIGLHQGQVTEIDSGTEGVKKAVGMPLNIAARIMGLSQGEQILLTRAIFDDARQFVREHPEVEGTTSTLVWKAHGKYLLKGADEPLEVFEVGAEGFAPLSVPPDSDKAKRAVTAEEEATLGWRPAIGLPVPNRDGWILERRLGEGGFGEVWRATHQKLKRQRVFKFCFDVDRLRSFKREVTLFRFIKHALGERKDIAAILDIQIEKAPFFLELECVEAGDLKHWADAQGGIGHVPFEQRLKIVAQVADALAAAHSLGIIHKDIKPSNVLIKQNEDGSIQPQLMDFGIGFISDSSKLEEAGITVTGFTETVKAPNESSRTGTRMYAPPESLAGKPFTTQGDVYAVGVFLYQMAIGNLTKPLATGWQRDVDDEILREDIGACVDGDPARRFGSVVELVQRLNTLKLRHADRITKQEAQLKVTVRRRLVRLSLATSALLLVFSVTLGIGYFREKAFKVNLQQSLYAANMNLAQSAWEQNNVGRVRDLLEESATHQERGFEWYYWNRQTHLELMTLRGHTGGVNSVGFSPDGSRIVTGSLDHTAKLWNAAGGKELLTLKAHSGMINSVAISRDSRRVVTGSSDHTAKIWDAISGKELLTLKGHTSGIHSVAFSSDGQRIVTGTWGNAAKVWDAISGKELLTLNGGMYIYLVAFSPDGRRIVGGSVDNAARIWEAATGKELVALNGHSGRIMSVAYSSDGRWIVTGSQDATAKVWEVAGGKELLTLRGHRGWVLSVAFFADGQRVVTGSEDQTAKVWETASGKELLTLKGHSGNVDSVVVSPDGEWIVTGSEDCTAKVWETTGFKDVLKVKGHASVISSVAFSPDSRRIITGSFNDYTAKVWDAVNGKEMLALKGHTGGISSVAFSSDGQRIVTGSSDNTAKIWNAASGNELLTLKGCTNGVSAVAFSPDGKQIVTGTVSDTKVRLWDSESGKELLTLQNQTEGIETTSLAFSPDSHRLVRGKLYSETIDVYDAESGEELLILKGTGGSASVAFSPDGRRILTGSSDRMAKVWDAVSGKELLTLKGHSAHITSVAFSPDGRRILTGSQDRTAKVWDAVSGKELLTLKGSTDQIRSVAFSPDGQRIVTGSGDGIAAIWEGPRYMPSK